MEMMSEATAMETSSTTEPMKDIVQSTGTFLGTRA
jgi:hypothetical protein